MRKIWNQVGTEPWEYEIDALRVEHPDLDYYEARARITMKWMKSGDFRPLLETIRRSGMLRGPVLAELAQMIVDERLKFAGGRGRRTDPEAAITRQFAADIYEDLHPVPTDDGKPVTSDALIRSVGSVFATGEKNVRQEITASRKSKPKPRNR